MELSVFESVKKKCRWMHPSVFEYGNQSRMNPDAGWLKTIEIDPLVLIMLEFDLLWSLLYIWWSLLDRNASLYLQ